MGKIKIGRDNKRDYESVKFFTESVEQEQQADEVPQPAEVEETPAEQQAVEETVPQEKPSAPKEKLPVAKQPKKKGGKR